MRGTDSTCWTELRAAAEGGIEARGAFALRYAPLVRAYLAARWRGSKLVGYLDDAVQDVFVECLRQGGALEKLEPGREGGFRAFFYGVVRNVALRVERSTARRRDQAALDEGMEPLADDHSLSQVFDRAWANALMREAAERQRQHAADRGEAATRRVELLRLRFQENLPIREIARRWNEDAATLHHEYARARAEFKQALLEVLEHYHPGAPLAVERECTQLLEVLGQ